MEKITNNKLKRNSYMKKYILASVATLFFSISQINAQSSEHKGLLWSSLHGLDYEFKAGVNIGGTSPLPLPTDPLKAAPSILEENTTASLYLPAARSSSLIVLLF